MPIHLVGGKPAFACRNHLYFTGEEGLNQRSEVVFKIIGAAVVYGFALFGLAKYLEAHPDENNPTQCASGSRPFRVIRPR